MTRIPLIRIFRLKFIWIFCAIILAFSLKAATVGAAGEETSRVAILPWKVNAAENMAYIKDALPELLTSRVGASRAVEIIRPDEVRKALGGMDDVTDKMAADVAATLNADYVLYGSLTVLGSSVSLDSKLLEVSTNSVRPFTATGKGMDSVIGLTDTVSAQVIGFITGTATAPTATAPVPPTIAPPAVAPAPVPPRAEADEEPSAGGFILKPEQTAEKGLLFRSEQLKGPYVAMTAADLNHNGVKEIFIVAKTTLAVIEPGPDGVKVVKEIQTGSGQNIFIDSIDSDGDGTPEVYVSRVDDNRPDTRAIEYEDGDYRFSDAKTGWLVRTIRPVSGEEILIGQRFRGADGFYGGLHALRREGDRLTVTGPYGIDLPGELDLYRFELIDITGDGSPEIAAIDGKNHIRVYEKTNSSWDPVWKSADFYGGTVNHIEYSIDIEAGHERRFIPVAGRLRTADTDGDGTSELLVRKNTPSGLGWYAKTPRWFKKGAVASLLWDKDAGVLREAWSTMEFGGFVADFLLEDLDGDGTAEMTLLIMEGAGKLFGSEKSYVLSYRLDI